MLDDSDIHTTPIAKKMILILATLRSFWAAFACFVALSRAGRTNMRTKKFIDAMAGMIREDVARLREKRVETNWRRRI